jgi:hypothetical protein
VSLRVVQWGTGVVGRRALDTIVGHPELELVGVIVHDPAKAGRDAADLCALAARPDAVCYNAVGTGARDVERMEDAVDDIAGLLGRGIDVVSTSVTPLVYPPTADARWRAAIELACEKGNTSCFVSGAHPGFATDLLPLVMSGLCARIESLKVTEIINYETWAKTTKRRAHFGFGMPADFDPPTLAPGFPTRTWGSVLVMLAAALDVRLDEIVEKHESWITPTAFEVRDGIIEPGTRAAIHFGLHGMVGTREVLVVDHVYRAHTDAAPDWPRPPGAGGYRVEVIGEPCWTVDFGFVGVDGTGIDAGELTTAVRVVNAIPAVCDAPPGLLTPLDLPLVTGRGLVRRG